MDIYPPDSQLPESPVTDVPDEFASGSMNGIRRLYMRLVRWLFKPEYLPDEFAWFFAALVVTNLLSTLTNQPRGYWIDPGISNDLWLINIPVNWGPWVILGISIAYLLLLCLALKVIYFKPAFLLWLVLCILHLCCTNFKFSCYRGFSLPFINGYSCETWLISILLVEAVLFACMLAAAARLGVVSLLPEPAERPEAVVPGWVRNIKWAAIAWMAAASAAIVLAVFSPQPEWRLLHPEHAPSGRLGAALAYDSTDQRAVLFGGSMLSDGATWTDLNDTWVWDGKDWQAFNPAASPLPRQYSSMVYDEKQAAILLFGGSSRDGTGKQTYLNDMWKWDGVNWEQVLPAHLPPVRMKAAIYYDPAQEKVFLFGGYARDEAQQKDVFYNDTWAWDGSDWSEVTIKDPKLVFSADVLYDPQQQMPVMLDNDGLWSILDRQWYQPNYSSTPVGRHEGQIAYDAARRQIVLFGGYRDKQTLNDTWVFNGTTWEKIITKNVPEKRNGHSLFFDAVRGKVILFGGWNGQVVYGDLWELTLP